MSIKNSILETEIFSKVYKGLSERVFFHGEKNDTDNPSGRVSDLGTFLTIVNDPVSRCVGGNGRNINVFFLLAEALWIWAGRDDVAYLKIFNSRMSNFSDDGKVFHGSYGRRLRGYGKNEEKSVDQIKGVLDLLVEKPLTRQAAITIWNPHTDLNVESKDIPCNDLLMFKIKGGKLNLTIGNRSNDLHWGLCTNLFQFSFVLELMSLCLGVEVGTQKHLSDSLHVYTQNDLTTKMISTAGGTPDLYDLCESRNLKISSGGNSVSLGVLDNWVKLMLTVSQLDPTFASTDSRILLKKLDERAPSLSYILKLISIYSEYKGRRSMGLGIEDAKNVAINKLLDLTDIGMNLHPDFHLLAFNFFFRKKKQGQAREKLREKFFNVLTNIPNVLISQNTATQIAENMGKL